MFKRYANNPIITPAQVTPSRPDFEVIGVFNAGVTQFNGETLLLLRVAERPIQTDKEIILAPYLSEQNELVLKQVNRHDPDYDTSDPRQIIHRRSDQVHLTSISHLRLARSNDGIHFTIDKQPWLMAQSPYESFGVEDARITKIGETYYINYTAVSSYGIATALVSTHDFVTIRRSGIIFPPSNRDVTIFPEQIGGQYICYHRPMPGQLGSLNIWMATSPDLIHWGNHRIVLEKPQDGWESGRVGGGAPPLKTERGWLSIYHAADVQNRYCLGAFLTPLDRPDKIIGRSKTPILEPQALYEIEGFFGNVVFTCGAVLDDQTLKIYYGAADDKIALVEANVDDVLAQLS